MDEEIPILSGENALSGDEKVEKADHQTDLENKPKMPAINQLNQPTKQSGSLVKNLKKPESHLFTLIQKNEVEYGEIKKFIQVNQLIVLFIYIK